MIDSKNIRFTICFLTRKDDILLLFRNKPPNQGLWNGVGGHIEPDETPRQSCLREIREETGYIIDDIKFGGILTWKGFEIPEGGLYIYTALAPEHEPLFCDEGQLSWFSKKWVFNSPQVVSNIHYFLPCVIKGDVPCEYYFEYKKDIIAYHDVKPLPQWLDISIV